jgi:alpha-L-arabinofuranosidase
MIHAAVKAKHPEITVIGTVGPFHSGADYEEGWRIADELRLEMVDEHYYEKPEWFLGNLNRYDAYDRARSKVYLGEYASQGNTLFNALAEAAYLTGLERNGDVVRLASYAPLLGKVGDSQWNPDLIYFNNTAVSPTVNYYVQQLFSLNSGDVSMPVEAGIPASCVRDTATGDLILKIVNVTDRPMSMRVEINGPVLPKATRTVLSGDREAQNTLESPRTVIPVTSEFAATIPLTCEVTPFSLTMMRFRTR